MAGDVDLTLDIRGRNADALRAIAGTKAAMRSMRSEHRALIQQTRDQARYNAELNKQLDRQRGHVRALTGDYIALRRALFTLGIRAAITGFSALSSITVSLGGDVVKLTREVGMLSVAVGQTSLAMGQGIAQGMAVWKLAMKDVDKALTSSGKDRKKAMDDLTKEGRNLVRELEPLREAYKELQLLSQKGLSPGLGKAANKSKALIDELRDSVWNTSRAIGYLADHAATRLVKKQGDVRTALRLNIIAGRRAGDSLISLGEAYLTAYVGAEDFVDFTTREIVKWSRKQREAIDDARRNGDLADFYNDAREAWKVWTSTLGATGRAGLGILKASEESSERMARNINDAAKNAEKWIKSEKGQKKIKDNLEALEPVSGEIAKALGATAESFINIGVEGADSAERILRGYRTDILPLIEEIAVHLDEGMLESFIDLTRESVEFVDTAMPALTAVSDVIAEIVESGAEVLSWVNQATKRMPAFNQAVAGLAIGAGILIGWGRLKHAMELVILRARQIVGLAPRITPALHAMSAGGGVVGGAGGGVVVGAPGRSAGTRRGGASVIASGGGTGMRTTGNGGSFMMPAPPRNAAAGMAPLYGRDGKIRGGSPIPRSQTLTRPGGNAPLTRLAMGPRGPVFYPLSVQGVQGSTGRRRPLPGGALPPLAPMPGLTKGDPLTGIQRGNSATDKAAGRQGRNAGRAQWVGALAANSARGAADGMKSGLSKGVRDASPIFKGALKFGIAGAALGGILGALSSGELKNSLSNRIGRAASGMTLGALQSPDDRATSFMADTQRAMKRGGTVSLDARSDEQRAVIGKFRKDKLNMMNPEDVRILKEWATASEQAGKMSSEQADALHEAADAHLTYMTRVKESKEANKVLKRTTLNESDLKPGIESLSLLEDRFKAMRDTAKPTLNDVEQFTKNSMHNIKQFMVKGSLGAKQATSSAFMETARAIKRGMREGTISAEEGAKKLDRIFRRNLAQWGYSKSEIDNYVKSPVGDTAGKDHGKGSRSTFAKGGFFVGRPGERGQDNVPAMLNGEPGVVARGEYVGILNGEQQAAFDAMAREKGYGGLRGFFEKHNTPHSRTRKFAKGGIVGIPGEPGESIHSSILGDVLRLKRRYKLDITDGYATSGHAAAGEHPKGLAIDAVPGKGGSWDLVDRLARWAEPTQGSPRSPFRWVGYDGDANHGRGNHIHLSWLANAVGVGSVGELRRVLAGEHLPVAARAMVQGGLDAMRGLGNARLSGIIGGSGIEGAEPGSLGGVTGRRLMEAISKQKGWNFNDWWTIDGRESAHGRNLTNPTSTARLRGQFLDFNWGKFGKGSDPRQSPSMDDQIWSMAEYIEERYGNPTAALQHHNQHNWYSAGKPPSPPGSDSPAPKVDTRDAVPPSSKPDKSKGKTPPVYAGGYPSGVKDAIAGSRQLISKGKKGKVKPYKIRSKVKKLKTQLKNGRWFDDPDFVDPLTGESIDVDQLGMFAGIRKLRERMPGLAQKATNMQSTHALTDEYATLSLQDDDLKSWLRGQGMTEQAVTDWIAKFGNTLEVANHHGFPVHGQFMRGLDHFGGEVGGEIGAISAIQKNWQGQKTRADKTNPGKALAKRRERLKEIRRIFNSNRKVIDRTKKKLSKMKGKGYGWRAQIKDNDSIIDALQDHARNSRNLPEAYRDRISDDIDSLRDLNRDLREKKPKNMPLGHGHLAKLLGQRQRENSLIAGQEGVTDWVSAVQGSGLAGAAAGSLSMWKGARDYKQEVVGEAKQGIFDTGNEIAALSKSLEDFRNAMWVPNPEALNASSASPSDEVLKEIGRNALKQERLGQFERSELAGFAKMLGMRSMGAFAHGAVRINETGMALLHRNETVLPDPNGPFRNGMTVSRLQGDAGGDVYLIAEGDVGALFRMLDVRVRRATGSVSADQGRMSRAIRAAPGR